MVDRRLAEQTRLSGRPSSTSRSSRARPARARARPTTISPRPARTPGKAALAASTNRSGGAHLRRVLERHRLAGLLRGRSGHVRAGSRQRSAAGHPDEVQAHVPRRTAARGFSGLHSGHHADRLRARVRRAAQRRSDAHRDLGADRHPHRDRHRRGHRYADAARDREAHRDGIRPARCFRRGHAAVASSVESSSHGAALAVDGDTTTRWSSAFSDPQWIYVDLGASHTVNRVLLNWQSAYGKAYQIQTSTNASTWTTVYSTTTGDGGIDDLSLSGSGRYVRHVPARRAPATTATRCMSCRVFGAVATARLRGFFSSTSETRPLSSSTSDTWPASTVASESWPGEAPARDLNLGYRLAGRHDGSLARDDARAASLSGQRGTDRAHSAEGLCRGNAQLQRRSNQRALKRPLGERSAPRSQRRRLRAGASSPSSIAITLVTVSTAERVPHRPSRMRHARAVSTQRALRPRTSTCLRFGLGELVVQRADRLGHAIVGRHRSPRSRGAPDAPPCLVRWRHAIEPRHRDRGRHPAPRPRPSGTLRYSRINHAQAMETHAAPPGSFRTLSTRHVTIA